jgi:fructokinase
LHGLMHPEMGHFPVSILPGDDFDGVCPFHGRCLEGMVSGPALVERAGQPLADVPPDDPLWDLAARYLAQGLASIVYALSPRRIVLGGGVMRQPQLLPRIQQALLQTVNGYLPIPAFARDIESYIVLSPLDQKAGLYGALVLAERALATATKTGSPSLPLPDQPKPA